MVAGDADWDSGSGGGSEGVALRVELRFLLIGVDCSGHKRSPRGSDQTYLSG
jgi:hypothetical protein